MERALEIQKLYKEGKTYKEIGEIFNVSKQRIEQILKKYSLKIEAPSRTERYFWEKVIKTNDCWLWKGSHFHTGYARFRFNGKSDYAHRYSKSLLETLDTNKEIDHLCRNRGCVNPTHLEQVDHQTNCARRIKLSTA